MEQPTLRDIAVLVRGAGDIATGVAHRLFCSGFRVCMTEIPEPLAIRRAVCFSEAVYEGEKTVEGVTAKRLVDAEAITATWKKGRIPLLVDPQAELRKTMRPHVIVDAIMAKKNLGTTLSDASLVIALGPGFLAGTDVHLVIETNRGHDLGRLIREGAAEPDTGVPGVVGGYAEKRVLRAPEAGRFDPFREIGDVVEAGDVVADVNGVPMRARISGVLRGVLREGTMVHKGMKSGDVDARGNREACFTISDKARAIGGSVLEGILATFNR